VNLLLLLLVAAGVGGVLAGVAWWVLDKPLVTVFLLVSALPWGAYQIAAGVQLAQLLSAAAAGATGLAALAGGGNGLRRTGPLLWATALVAEAFLSVLTATNAATSLRATATYAVGLALAWAVAWTCRDWATIRRVVTLFCIIGAGICLTALGSVAQLRSADSGNVVTGRAVGVFGQPNELGSFAAIVMVLALACFFAWPPGRARLACLLAGAAGTAGLLLSLSRGAWIGAALGVLLLAVLVPAVRRPLAAVAGGTVALGAAFTAVAGTSSPVIAIVVDRLMSITSPSNPYDDRPAIWAEAIRQTAEHPILGVGAVGFPGTTVYENAALHGSPADHAHNILLVLASEQGLLGLLIFGGLVLTTAIMGTRVLQELDPAVPVHSRRRALVAGMLAALASVLGQGAIDFPLRHPVLSTTVWLLLGLVAAAINLRTGTASREPDGQQVSADATDEPARQPA
jgi:O-antigen ligase